MNLARMLAGDGNLRVNKLAETAALDPVVALELLRVANATFFAADKPSISSLHAAVVRLGSDSILGILDRLQQRPQFSDSEVVLEFETLRALSQRTSEVAKLIGSIVHPDLTEVAHLAALMANFGHLLACALLGQNYLAISRTKKRNAVPYRLAHDFGLDIHKIQIDYLRKQGLPQEVFFGIDRNLTCKNHGQAGLRFITEAAVEIVDAFESQRWQKYAPGKPLPPQSALRMLKVNNGVYSQLYETLSSFFTLTSNEPEMQEPAVESSLGKKRKRSTIVLKRGPSQAKDTLTDIFTLSVVTIGQDHTEPVVLGNLSVPRDREEGMDDKDLSSRALVMLNLIRRLCQECRTTQDLLGKLLSILVTDGPFVRAALLHVSDEAQAMIHTAVGDWSFESTGSTVDLGNPLSALNTSLSSLRRIEEQQTQRDRTGGEAGTFAVSQIRVRNNEPTVLYADCGLDLPISGESQNIFKLVVGLLNETLPHLPV